jgi:hypothetical protein
MIKLRALFLIVPALILFSGCGGSTATTPVAEQDEIAKYAAEHPESSKPNTEGINP